MSLGSKHFSATPLGSKVDPVRVRWTTYLRIWCVLTNSWQVKEAEFWISLIPSMLQVGLLVVPTVAEPHRLSGGQLPLVTFQNYMYNFINNFHYVILLLYIYTNASHKKNLYLRPLYQAPSRLILYNKIRFLQEIFW